MIGKAYSFVVGVAAAMSLSTSCIAAVEVAPHFAKGTSYKVVRAKLMATGWRPVALTPPGACGIDADQCPKVPEVIVCSGAGALAPCFYAWRKGASYLQVQADGEGSPQAFDRIEPCKSFRRGDPQYRNDWICVH